MSCFSLSLSINCLLAIIIVHFFVFNSLLESFDELSIVKLSYRLRHSKKQLGDSS